MEEIVPYFGAFTGTMLGFSVGVGTLLYITKGLKLKEVLGDRGMRFWMGLFAWFFAAVGGYIGWAFFQ